MPGAATVLGAMEKEWLGGDVGQQQDSAGLGAEGEWWMGDDIVNGQENEGDEGKGK